MIIKLSAECLAAVGAKTADEFPSRLAALLNTCSGMAAKITGLETGFATATETIGNLETALDTAEKTITAQAGKITTLETAVGNPAAMTEARIKTIATEAATIAGSSEAMKAIGATGNGAPPAPPSNNAGAATGTAALIAAGKFEEAWTADKNVQAEFPTAKGYAAFMRAQSNGQVRIVTRAD